MDYQPKHLVRVDWIDPPPFGLPLWEMRNAHQRLLDRTWPGFGTEMAADGAA